MWWSGVSLSDILEREKNNFDLVRMLAAGLVIVSHSFLLVHGPGASEPLASLSTYNLGQHAVNVFFVLSGLLVSASLDRTRGLGAFVWARALRIAPGLVVCVLITALVLGPLVTSMDMRSYFASPQLARYLLATLSLVGATTPLPGVFDAVPMSLQVNVPLWSLKYEVFCYATLTLLAATGVWGRTRLFWLFFIALLGGYSFVEAGHTKVEEHIAIDQVLRFAVCFFLGAAAYRIRKALPLAPLGVASVILALVLARQTRLEEPLTYVASGYLALCLAALPIRQLRRLFAGTDLSYGLYIYGWPIGQTIVALAPGVTPVALATLTLTLAILAAMGSWHLIERPALNLKVGTRSKISEPTRARI